MCERVKREINDSKGEKTFLGGKAGEGEGLEGRERTHRLRGENKVRASSN